MKPAKIRKIRTTALAAQKQPLTDSGFPRVVQA